MTQAPLTVDIDRNMLCRAGVEVRVVPRVAEIVQVMLDARGRPVSRATFEDRLFGMEVEAASSNLVSVHLCRARPHLAALGCHIINHHGRGWQLVQDEPTEIAVHISGPLAVEIDRAASASGLTRDQAAERLLRLALLSGAAA